MTGPALLLLFVLLPLGPFLGEVGAMVALAAGLAAVAGGARPRLPLLAPLGLVLAAGLAASLDRPPAHALEALRQAWGLVLVVALPLLASADRAWVARAERAGLGAAGAVAAWGVVEAGLVLAEGFDPAVGGARGPFSHHLTLGYALLPPAAWALWRRRWAAAALLAAGVLSSLGSGPALSLLVAAAGVLLGPGRALAGGLAVALALMAGAGALVPGDELLQRAVLWTTGAELAVAHPGGVGPAGFREAAAAAQDRILPGFHFPLHAHDSALQAAATLGVGGWVALSWLAWALWRESPRGGRAALAALAVGALSQDVLGDLEVVRAACGWALLGGLLPRESAAAAGLGRPAPRSGGARLPAASGDASGSALASDRLPGHRATRPEDSTEGHPP